MSVKIRYRADRKKWMVDFKDVDGKRRKPVFDSKLEAQNFARRIGLGLPPESKESITVEVASHKYHDTVSVNKNPKSRVNDKRYLNLHFHFMTVERGLEKLSSVGLDDLEAFRDWLPLQTEFNHKPMKMGHSTINRLLRVIKHFYKKHVQWKNLTESPCTHLELLEAEENERRAMTREEFEKAFKKAPEWFKPVFQFIYLTGAPASCIERLEWSDVDLSSRTLFFRRKKGWKAKWKRIPIPINDEVLEILLKQRNEHQDGLPFVFRNESKGKLDADWCTRVGNRAIKTAGLKDVTVYCLRHALATDLTEANVATELVRQAMGHSSIQTTQRYTKKAKTAAVAGALRLVR